MGQFKRNKENRILSETSLKVNNLHVVTEYGGILYDLDLDRKGLLRLDSAYASWSWQMKKIANDISVSNDVALANIKEAFHT